MLWIADSGGYYVDPVDAFNSPAGYGIWDGADGIFGAGWGSVGNITPFNSGQSFRTAPFFGGYLYKDGPNVQDMICCFWARHDSGPWDVSFDDGGTNQVTIDFNGVGEISVNTANGNLGRWEDAYNTGQWDHWQIRVHIDRCDGVVRIRKNGGAVKNGILADNFEVCGNTQMTANAYTNRFRFTTLNNSAWSYVKDICAWDMTGPGPWNNWVGVIRSYDAQPISDAAVQFAQTIPGGRSTSFGFPTNTFAFTLDPNTVYLYPVTPPPIGGLLGNLTLVMDAGFTGNLVAGLYCDGGKLNGIEGNGDGPGTLLAQTNTLVNPVTGSNTLTWAGGAPSVTTGRKYWLAYWTDATFRPRFQGGAVGSYQFVKTFTGTLDNPVDVSEAIINAFAAPPTLSATLTVTNAALVDEVAEDQATTMVSDANVGDQDLYGIHPLPGGMESFLHVDLVIFAKKSLAGTRAIAPLLKSGATLTTEADIVPNLTFNYFRYKHENDPNTGVPWVRSDIEAVEIGQKVSL